MAGAPGANSPFGGDDDGGHMITDINVTPLVDITLVLLIIFMVTTTYMVNPSVKVDLPKASTGTTEVRGTMALTITKEGAMYINGEKTDDAGLTKFITSQLPTNPDLQAVIAADKVVPHGQVVHVIDLVKRAGVRKFAINVEGATAGAAPTQGGAAGAP